MTPTNHDVVDLSPWKYLAGCASASALLLVVGRFRPFPAWVVAAEVLLTVFALFLLGSFRYRLNKNALTYGAVMVVSATFWESWWPSSSLRERLGAEGAGALWDFVRRHFLTLHGLDDLVHADTMLFILGLTFFVAVIAQTRLLETVSFKILNMTRGHVVTTVGLLMALVSAASGILDGVSMIGLMIRTLVIILFLARASDAAVLYAVMVSTVVTTVCGMWLAYGEPPNLIMKSNLHPHLTNGFFLRYCLPVAVGSYFIVLFNVRSRLRGKRVDLPALDVLDRHTDDVRFLQAAKHGEVLTAVEFIDAYAADLGPKKEAVERRLHQGEPLGRAMVEEDVPPAVRKNILGHFLEEELGGALDEHYARARGGDARRREEAEAAIQRALDKGRAQRRRAQRVGGLAFAPFVGLLIAHAVNHDVPLFYSSMAGFAVALAGVWSLPRLRSLALREARHEFAEYFFLLPLFFSIALLQKSGFFGAIAEGIHAGVERFGVPHLAYAQFTGAAFLSALLDNNVVADFAGRAIRGLELSTLHLFAMAQIAGYAVGGCWTHIGSAQSVVAYAFVRKEVDARYTPVQWMKAMTPLVLQIFLWMTVVVYGEAFLQQLNSDR